MDGLLQMKVHYVQHVKDGKMGKTADEIKGLRRNEFNKLGIKDELLKEIKNNLSVRPSMLIACNSHVNNVCVNDPVPSIPVMYLEAAKDWLLDEGFHVGGYYNKTGSCIGLEVWL